MAAGLPTEGRRAENARAGDVAREDVPTCSLDERLGNVAERVRASGWDACVVVNDDHVVFGLLRSKEMRENPGRRIEEVMRAGPSTFRPHVSAAQMAGYMGRHDLESAPITRSDGTLIGLLLRSDAERAAHEEHEKHEEGEDDDGD